VLAFIILLWSNWSWVKDLPGVSTIVMWRSQAPLPTADPQRFAVALAHLEDDQGKHHERLIREVLRGFEGVQLLQFDRTISLAGTEPEKSEQQGHALARQWLEDSGAHLLIWGLVLRQDGKSAPRLYWTTSWGKKRAKEVYQPENFKLPDLFWSDLVEVLRLVVAHYSAEFSAGHGQFMADRLVPFIERVKKFIAASPGQPGWSIDARMEVQFIQATALMIPGEQTGRDKPTLVGQGHVATPLLKPCVIG
jgi:hypothetical protein